MSRPGEHPGQLHPISFKTVPGRHRTQKWNQARTYNYDGDEWGGYDPYDEYDGYDEPMTRTPPPPPAESQSQSHPQSQRYGSEPPPGPQLHRQNSFDAGVDTERRLFSGPAAYMDVAPELPRGASPAVSASSAGGSRPSGDYDRHPRDRNFTDPEQAPPPLNTRASPAPAIPGPETMPETIPAQAPSRTDKPLPIIRPSDIYKRVEEERERERRSLDSSRPSMDSMQRAAAPVTPSALSSAEEPHGPHLPEYRPLSSLEQPPPFRAPTQPPKESSPVLPAVSRVSGFGSDLLPPSTADHWSPSDAPDENETPMASPQQERAATGTAVVAPTVPAERAAAEPDLQHQPSVASQGFRSVVHKAFDRKDDSSVPATPSLSRDNSQSVSDVSGISRSDTNSTSGISPIMSRVPSAATAHRLAEHTTHVPPIAEEPSPTQPRPASGSFQIPRKPSPGHSRDTSAETAISPGVVQPGFRRSLDPPSNGSSPARTPGIDSSDRRRVSAPMAAETVAPSTEEASDVVDQDAGLPIPDLHPVETPASEISQPSPVAPETFAPLPTTGRGRSGTDYSTREADIAHSVNYSPEKSSYSPPLAEDVRNSQQEFLSNHAGLPSSPTSPASPGYAQPFSPDTGSAAPGFAGVRAGTPGSGRASPARSRVREIADNYDSIHEASRRNSEATVSSGKSSWSNFAGSEENLAGGSNALKRKGTGLSQVESSESPSAARDDGESFFPQYAQSQDRSSPRPIAASGAGAGAGAGATLGSESGVEGPRPGLTSQASFRPDLPGGWVSPEPTPASEDPSAPTYDSEAKQNLEPSSLTPRASQLPTEEGDVVDLTPTTKKAKLPGNEPLPDPPSDAHQRSTSSAFAQAKDVGAALGATLMATAGLTSQTRDFASPKPAAPVEQPEMQPKASTGDISSYVRPTLPREDSGATTEGPTSVASSVPPAPVAKDAPQSPDTADGGRRDADDIHQGPGESSVSGYFSGAVAPLRPGQKKESFKPEGSDLDSGQLSKAPQLSTRLSADTGAEDYESDRLRNEIVQSLNPVKAGESKREGALEDSERTQDALDAPNNLRRVEQGAAPQTPAEIEAAYWRERNAESNAKTSPLPKLNQKFSWESRPPQSAAMPTPEIKEPEIRPEMPYERPRDKQLHVVNDQISPDESPVEEKSPRPAVQGAKQESLPAGITGVAGFVSPMSHSQENLRSYGPAEGGMLDLSPSPISETHDTASADSGSRLPSYYQSDAARSPALPAPVREESETPREGAPPETSSPGATATAAKRQSASRIPPFREILAIKDGATRTQTYNETRVTFASMDTGLNDWLSGMLVQHPEHANLSVPSGFRPPAVGSSGTFGGRHRHNPSIIKIAKQFSHSDSGERKASVASAGGDDGPDGPPKTPSKEHHLRWGSGGGTGIGDDSRIDMDRMQQRGKDLMKSAGVLGGRAQAGAKGLFAKGRTRFGTLKRDSSDKAQTLPPQDSSLPPHATVASSPLPTDATVPAATTAAVTAAAAAAPASTLAPSVPSSSASLTAPTPRRAHSRASSMSSALGLKRSQTPSSMSAASRPLSQAFERLRDRSRSKSTGHSRSKSRPASLVITNPDLGRGSDDEHSVSAAAAATATAAATSTAGSAAGGDVTGGQRVEVWNESDVAVPLHDDEATEEHSSATPAKLGVLPSPSVGEFEGTERDSPSEHLSLAEIPPEDKGADDSRGLADVAEHLSRAATGVQSPAEVPVSATVAEDQPPSEPPPPERPPQGRRVSAIETLPSQQRTRSLGSPQTATIPPFSDPWGDSRGQDEKTPTASHAQSPAIDKLSSDDNVDGSTPIAPQVPVPWQKRRGDVELAAAAEPRDEDAQQVRSGNNTSSQVPQSAATALGIVAATEEPEDVARRVKGDDASDNRSEVSREDEAQDAGETTFEKAAGSTGSRRSSVSSLESPRTVFPRRPSILTTLPTPQDPQRPMSAEAIPAGPISSTIPVSDGDVQQPSATQEAIPQAQRPGSASGVMPEQQKLMGRYYGGGIMRPQRARPERALSYTPLGTDATGAPVQESLDTGEQLQAAAVDLTGLAGPRPGTPPCQQQPVLRNSAMGSQSGESEQPSTQADIMTPTPARSRQTSSDAGNNRKSKRFSGLFRSHDRTADSRLGAPPRQPSAADDPSGLQKTYVRRPDDPGSVPTLQQADKQDRRRSSIWESLKRTPSSSRPSFSTGSSTRHLDTPSEPAPPPVQATVAGTAVNTAKPKMPRTLKKPQRAGSAATLPEEVKQKHRFSGLGRLFGRSSTQGHSTPKPHKLAKTKPLGREDSWGQNSTSSVNVEGYAQNKATRRQQSPDLHGDTNPNLTVEQPPADLDASGVPIPGQIEPHSEDSAAGENQPSDNAMLPGQDVPVPQAPRLPQQYRRLHSERFHRGLQYANVPEAFRPTDASYGEASQPIGPPPDYQSPIVYRPLSTIAQSQPTLPTSQPYWGKGSPPSPAAGSRQRQFSSGSAGFQLSPQISGRSEYQHGQWTRDGSIPSISPVQSNAGSEGFPPRRDQRMGSIDHTVARSPAREYNDQQTPWTISLPPGDNGSRRSSRSSPQPMQASGPPPLRDPYPPQAGYQPVASPPSANSGYPPHDLPMSPQSPGGTQFHGSPMAQPTLPIGVSQPLVYYGPPTQEVARIEDHTYPSQPYTSETLVYSNYQPYNTPQQQRQYGTLSPMSQVPLPEQPPLYVQQQQGALPPQQRYYGHQPSRAPAFVPDGLPLTYQSTSSGYAGRRDDATVGEQDLVMRGASYPGQEWRPTVYGD